MVYLDNMYPSKSVFDYMSEIQRLFPRSPENDHFQQSMYSPPYQPAYANHSSSSADSTSPESYFDRCAQPVRRPIIGRRLHQTPPQDSEISSSPIRWNIPEEFSTPKRSDYQAYELFPQRKELFPVARTPTSASYSPPSVFLEPPPIYSMHRPAIEKNFSAYSGPMICTFCRKNGEMPSVYIGHTVRRRVGNRSVVTCNILRHHVCEACGATGDDAHTISYCPERRKFNNGVPLQSTTITLKNTRVKSNGRRRF